MEVFQKNDMLIIFKSDFDSSLFIFRFEIFKIFTFESHISHLIALIKYKISYLISNLFHWLKQFLRLN